jgi:hypothetical protein
MNPPIILKSGAEFQYGLPPFSSRTKLYKTLCSELLTVDVKLESLDLNKLAGTDVNTFKNLIFKLIGSDAFERAIFECAKKSQYNGRPINPDLFESEEATEDWFPVAWEVAKAVILPFAKNLALSSLTSAKESSESLA